MQKFQYTIETFIDDIKSHHDDSQRTNAHLRDNIIKLGDWDVKIIGSGDRVKILVYSMQDKDRLEPTLRFEYCFIDSVTFLGVALAVWKFCKKEK